MAIDIEAPEGEAALTEFVQFYDRVYEQRPVRWQAMQALELPMLLGTSPFAEGRTIRSLVARDGGELVARCVAAVDQRYLDHWGDDVGHVALFEAMPGTREATRQLMDEACGWLRSQGMNAALRAVVRTALAHGVEVYAIYEGYQGMVEGGTQIRPLSWGSVGAHLKIHVQLKILPSQEQVEAAVGKTIDLSAAVQDSILSLTGNLTVRPEAVFG